jgi:amino acid adenylation domain-containing protein
MATTGYLFSFPLSFAQQRLWFLEQLQPGLIAYNLPGAVRLRGPLVVASLERALGAVVTRHESLRTTIRPMGDSAVQIVSSEDGFRLPLVDLSGFPPEQREKELMLRIQEEARQSFDLVRGPLFRSALYRLGPEHHILMLAMHHIVTDGWSIGVLVEELGVLYSDICRGREPSLPELPIQYPDFAEWQRDWLQGETLERMLSYWRNRLQGAPAVLDLPADYPRPAVERYRGAQFRFTIPLPVAQALSSLARREGATLFMALLAAFKVLLSRYSGQADIVVGSPIAGRDRSELEGLIGLFVNTLVLKTYLGGAPGFREILGRVRETCLGAYEHQDLPFEKLVEELKPERDLSRNPLFQVMFALQNAPLRPLSLEDLTITPVEFDRGAAQLDLALHMQETDEGLLGVFEYSTDLFESGTIERMAGHFVTLLEAAVSEPDRRVSDLPWLTEAERRQVLVEWNATSKSYPETTIHRLIEEQVRRTPDAVALAFEGRTMSYGELNQRANQLARHLRGLGVGPDTLVGLCIERSFEMVVGLLGILKSGGAYVPVDPGYPPDRQSYMIADSRAPVLLTQASLAGGLADSGARVVVLDAGWEEIVRHPDGDLEDGSGPGHLAYVIYTSGSTGKPKGAMNEHRAVCNRLLWMQDTYGLTASDRILQKTPFSFDVSVWEFFWPLMTGARLVIAHPEGHKDPSYLVHRIREEGITTLHFVPSMLRAFLEAEGVEECSSVKRVICSGEALPYELQERFFGRLGLAELHNLYGPTEAAVDVTWWPCERGSARKVVPIGRPVANTQMYVLDCSLNPVPVGVPGELYIGGVQVGRGYWGRPELTAEKFIPDPFRPGGRLYKTGDLSRWLPDGVIEYLGRNDFQVKVRGLRIELGEIEAALSEHVTVGQAVVVSREETPGDVRLVAYLVPRADASPSVADLRVFLKDRLPEYMIPSAFVILPSLPLNPSGKVDRKALPAPERMRSSLATQYEAPRTEVEAMIAELWKDVLRLEKVGVHDNFFDLGGHSLLLVQVQARLERHLKRKLAVVDLFQYPSIETLSRHLTSDEDVAPARERIDSRADRQRQAMSRHRDRKGQEGGTP